MKLLNKNKGITLIALVITIILLLILAGISISALTGSGLFEKAKLAKQKAIEAEVKEKIELLLYEYQMKKIDNEDLNLFEYFSQKKEGGEIDTVKDNRDGTIEVGLKGYTVTINTEKMSVINIEQTNDIEFSYEVISYDNSKFKILIKVSDKSNGINTIQYPNGDIKNCDGQKELEIEYEVEEGIDYVFIAKNTNGIEKREVVNFTKPAKPVITDINGGYLTLTLTGAEGSEIEISYDEREEFLNYYSLDNGVTWNLYTGSLKANSNNIKAKSVHKKCQDIFEEVEKVIAVPVDAITWNSFDNNIDTYDLFSANKNYQTFKDGHYCLLNLDSSSWEQALSITYFLIDSNNGYRLGLKFYNEEGVEFAEDFGPIYFRFKS